MVYQLLVIFKNGFYELPTSAVWQGALDWIITLAPEASLLEETKVMSIIIGAIKTRKCACNFSMNVNVSARSQYSTFFNFDHLLPILSERI